MGGWSVGDSSGIGGGWVIVVLVIGGGINSCNNPQSGVGLVNLCQRRIGERKRKYFDC